MERKPGITFTPWETDEGSKTKRHESTVTPTFFPRNFDSTTTDESCNADDIQTQSLKDVAAGSSDAHIGSINLFGVPIVCLYVEGRERLCLAQISNTLLRDFSYNEIHNRRVALGITCMQCSPIQLEVLRRSGAMPVSSRRCGLITKREAERLVKSFLEDIPPPKLPETFSFQVQHTCGWGCQGMFMPSRYNSSRAKCIKCTTCNTFFSPNKFIFHYHKTASSAYRHPDAANFNSWRRHLHLVEKSPAESLLFAWEDVKAMFNGGCRKRTSGGKSNINLSPNSTRETSDYKTPVISPIMRSYPGLQSNNLYRLEMGENMLSAFPVQSGHTPVASYGDMLRSMSLSYSPWWKSLYVPRHGVPSTCTTPFNSNFNMSNYGHPQFPLPIIDTTETFMDEMNKLSEITSNQDKKGRKKHSLNSNIQQSEETAAKSYLCDEDNVDIETNEKTACDDQEENKADKIYTECTEKIHLDTVNMMEKESKAEEERYEKMEGELCDDNKDGNSSSEDGMYDDSDLESFSVDKLKEFLLKAKQLKRQKDRKRRSKKDTTQSVDRAAVVSSIKY